jgi:hypothetical protein
MNLQQQGIITEDQVVDALNKNLKQTLGDQFVDSLKLDKPDPDKWQKALSAKELQQQYQYAQTHPNSAVYDKNGVFMGLNKESSQTYLAWVNKTLYGQDGKLINSDPNGSLKVPAVTLTPNIGWTKSEATVESNGNITYDDGIKKTTVPAVPNQWVGMGANGGTINGYSLPANSSIRYTYDSPIDYIKSKKDSIVKLYPLKMGDLGQQLGDDTANKEWTADVETMPKHWASKIGADPYPKAKEAGLRLVNDLIKTVPQDILWTFYGDVLRQDGNGNTIPRQEVIDSKSGTIYEGQFPLAMKDLYLSLKGIQKARIVETNNNDGNIDILIVKDGKMREIGFRKLLPEEANPSGGTMQFVNNNIAQPVQKVG